MTTSGSASTLRCLGPGLFLSAAVVGSGDPITTTALGAKAGFVLLCATVVRDIARVLRGERPHNAVTT